MTQDELNLVLDALKFCHGGEPCGTAEAIAVVEKALAQTQEPVADDFFRMIADRNPKPFSLPQRKWAGLFDEEIEVLFQTAAGADEEVHIRFARAIESKIKELNT